MKVLLVSQPGADGVLRHVAGLAEYLLAQGEEVHLAYSDRTSGDQLQALVAQVRAAGGETYNMAVGNSPELGDVRAMAGLRNLAARTRPEVVHAHSSKAGGLVRVLRPLGLRQPIFYTPHAYYRMHDPGHWKARCFHAIERLLSPAARTIAMSRDESEFASRIIGISPQRQHVLANGVDCARFHPCATPEARAALRAAMDLPTEAFVFGTVGRFSLQKDPLTMYRAFRIAFEAQPDVYFVHLGRGELEPAVDALLAGTGFAARCRRVAYLADPAPFYRTLDAFLLPSLYEGMSFAVLEALATNLPVVLTDAVGNRHFRDSGLSHVFWSSPGDAASLASALRICRESTGMARPLNHRKIALGHFSEEACYSAIRTAYREALG